MSIAIQLSIPGTNFPVNVDSDMEVSRKYRVAL